MKWPPPSTSTLDSPDVDEHPDEHPDERPDERPDEHTVTPDSPPSSRPPAPPETDDERRQNSATPAAAWIALLGSGLLIVAAIAVVASNWDTIGQSFRVAGLALVTGGLLLVSERSRRLVPTTAGIIAHVGTFLVGFAAIAVMSLFGFTWPSCLMVGGAAVVIATTIQADRWRRVTMHAGQVAGIALAATGAAAVFGTSAGLVAAVASVGLLAMGGQRRSVGLALLAVFSPLLTAVADAGIGAGSLERAGLVGDRLSWSGPMVGLLAATVLGAVAMQRRNNPLMLLAVLAPVMGVVTGLASIDGSAIAWWCVPALVVIAGELGWWLLPDDRFKLAIGGALSSVAGAVAVGAWFSPAIFLTDLPATGLDSPWAIPIAATAVAVALTTLRWRADDSLLADLGVASIAASAIGTFVAFDASWVLIAPVAVLATTVAAFTSRRLAALAIYPTAFWALVSIAEMSSVRAWTTELILPLSLLGALTSLVVVIRARIAAAEPVLGWIELSLVTLATVALTVELTPSSTASAAAMIAAAFVGLLACLVESRHTVWAVTALGVTGAVAFRVAGTNDIEPTYWLGWAAATVAFGVAWLVHRSPVSSYAAAAAAVLTAAAAAGALDTTPEDFTVMAMLGVVALTGVAYTMPRRGALDAAAATAGVLLLGSTGFDIDPAWVSGAWLVIGLQIATYGAILRSIHAKLGGGAIAFAGAASWIWTTGFDEWFVDLLEPADIRADDLWMALVSLAALAAGLVARATARVNSWIAYTAALVIPGLWLTVVEVERSTVWALPLLLTVGVGAALAGAWKRLGAPLVGGTAITLVGVFLASGSDLTAIPVWVWLALGGGVLIGAAVLIERTGRQGLAGLSELVSRWG